MSILVIAEHDNKTLKAATLNVITAAKQISDEVTVLVAGFECQEVANSASSIDGLKEVLLADNAALEHQLAEPMSELIAEKVKEGYSHVLAPATTSGKDYLPRVAAMLDVDQISDITKIIDAETFERPIYAGNAIATVKCSAQFHVITVRTTSFDSASAQGGQAPISNLSFSGDNSLSKFLKDDVAELDRPELTSAKIVVSGGRGLQSAENFKMLESLADKLGAALGASRAAVDAGYVPNDLQVGQTGKVVAPELYIAIGISGAIQHLAGMKDSKIIVAINKDEDAPIFQVADYGLVADLFEAVPELEKML